MNLQEIQEMTNKGYIDDPGEVEEVVQGIIGITMEELLDSVRGDYRTFFEAVLDSYDIHYGHMNILTWLDLVCLVSNLTDYGSKHGLSGADPVVVGFRKLCSRNLVLMLTEAGKNNYEIRMFLALNMRAFFRYLEQRHNDRGLACLHDIIGRFATLQGAEMANRVKAGKISIGDYLKSLSGMEQTPWKPWKDFDEYRSTMIKMNETEDLVVIKSFYNGYKEYMKLDDLMARIEALDEFFRLEDDEEMNSLFEEMEEVVNGKHN